MQTDIYARKFSLTTALKNYAEQRISSSLSRCSYHIRRVVMRLSDINASQSGKEKRCLIQITLVDLPDVIVEDVETDLYAAIDRAVGRATQVAKRKIKRQLSLRKQDRLISSKNGVLPV